MNNKIGDLRPILRHSEELLHFEPRRIELARQALQGRDLATGNVITEQRIRRQKVLVCQKYCLFVLIGEHDASLAGTWKFQRIGCPAVHAGL